MSYNCYHINTYGVNELSLENYINYWKEYFESTPEELKQILPQEIINNFDTDFYPEPYYGYLSEDNSNDALLLLINPGDVQLEKLYNANPGLSYESITERFNNTVKDRIINWNKQDYEKYEQLNKKTPAGKWRASRLKQIEDVVGQKLNFLHTIEFFPYHSKRWNVRKNLKQDWLYSLESTQLSVNAIVSLAIESQLKCIIGIGLDWTILFKEYSHLVELVNEEIMLGRTGKPAHRIYKYRVKNQPNSLPIVIYSGSSMNLPVNTTNAVSLLRDALEIEVEYVKS